MEFQKKGKNFKANIQYVQYLCFFFFFCLCSLIMEIETVFTRDANRDIPKTRNFSTCPVVFRDCKFMLPNEI